jgi:UDP-galactopyranose mutase
MRSFLNFYCLPLSDYQGQWQPAAMQAAIAMGCCVNCHCNLKQMTRDFIQDQKLPENPYGDWNESLIEDEAFALELMINLQSLENQITAQKVLDYIFCSDVMEWHDIEKGVSLHTAQRYLNFLGYQFNQAKKGQYTDGHEHEDVVYYLESVFIPDLKTIFDRIQRYSHEGVSLPLQISGK